jgi:hypothetical protein
LNPDGRGRTELGPVWAPLFWLHMAAIYDGSRPIDLSSASEFRKQGLVESVPHARRLPFVQASPAGDPGAEAQLWRQVAPAMPV